MVFKDIAFAGSVTCLAAALLYLIGRHNDSFVQQAEVLKSIPRVKKLRDLAQLLDAEVLPMVVTISGRVVSETPIQCETTDLRGVEEHYLKKVDIEQKKKCKCYNKPKKERDDAECWTLHTELKSSKCTEVPWHLDDGSGRVHVVGACGATGFVLPAGSSTFKESGQFLERNFKRIKIIGIKRIEQVLPVGTSLTIVGEACRDDDGTIRIQRPSNGPFYVSCQKIDKHIKDFANYARWCGDVSVGLALCGACLFATSAICYIMEWNRGL